MRARFPDWRLARKQAHLGRGESAKVAQEQLRDQELYERKLRGLDAAELEIRFQSAKSEAEAAANARAKERQRALDDYERQMVWHQSRAQADFVHWSQCAYLTGDEAVALSLGMDPRIVDWSGVKHTIPRHLSRENLVGGGNW